jgi:hypothetical protein
MITRFREYGLIDFDEAKQVYTIPTFYNQVIRGNLSFQYKEKKAYIDSIFERILQMIKKNLEETVDLSQEKFDENMMYLLNLFNYAKDLPDADLMYEKISEMATQYAAEKLGVVRYGNVIGRYNYFLSEIPNRSGYSLDPILYRYVKNQLYEWEDIRNITNDLIKRVDAQFSGRRRDSQQFVKLSKSLSNLYVFIQVSNEDEIVLARIRNKLRAILASQHVDEKTKSIIHSNIRESKNEDLFVFPRISFHKISDKQRKIAQDWRALYEKSPPTKKADLSRANINDGLRILIHYLMEKQVEEIDLSRNHLGYEDTEAVCDLLKYPGSLKSLFLGNNSLSAFSSGQLVKIAEGLEHNITLETLVINNNSLMNKDIKLLCDALRGHPKIKHIELHHNKFSEEGIGLLKQLMIDNPSIEFITTKCSWIQYHTIGSIVREGKEVELKMGSAL